MQNVKYKIIESRELDNVWEEEVVIGEHQSLRWVLLCVDKMPKQMDVKIRLAGRGSRAEVLIPFIGKKDGETVMNVTLIHDAPDTYGRVIAKAALFDEARFTLRGMLEITPQAKGADSYLLAKGLLMSPEARAEIYPQLEIQTDEVKASHGSSIGRIDPRQLFYLQSRGISKEDAERIILSGFFRDVARELPRECAAKFFQ